MMEMPTALSWRTTSDRMCGHEVIRILTLGPVTYASWWETRSKQTLMVNLLTESSPGNGKATVSTVFSWRMGIEAVVEHRTILMLISGSS